MHYVFILGVCCQTLLLLAPLFSPFCLAIWSHHSSLENLTPGSLVEGGRETQTQA